MTTKSPDPTADAIERGAHAIMDEMERINAEKAAFSGPVPRDRYLPDMRRYARAVIAALASPTQPSGESEVAAWAMEAAKALRPYFSNDMAVKDIGLTPATIYDIARIIASHASPVAVRPCSWCGFTTQPPYRTNGDQVVCDSCFQRWRFMGPDADTKRAEWTIINAPLPLPEKQR